MNRCFKCQRKLYGGTYYCSNRIECEIRKIAWRPGKRLTYARCDHPIQQLAGLITGETMCYQCDTVI